MEQIQFAVEKDIPHIMALMGGAVSAETPNDWYVTDDEDFVRRHIGCEGYTLKYIIDGEFAAFLIVRHPGDAEDNLGLELLDIPVEMWQTWHPAQASEKCVDGQTTFGKVQTCGESGRTALLSCVTHMESAAVSPAHRGKGLQGKLLAKAEEIEFARGTQYLMATVHPDNIYSLRNLEAAGYQCILETEKYGGLRRKVMCKALGTDN